MLQLQVDFLFFSARDEEKTLNGARFSLIADRCKEQI